MSPFIIFLLLSTLSLTFSIDETMTEGMLLPKVFGNYTMDDLKSSSSCGATLAKYNGIPAYSNGGNQGTGNSCAGCGSTGCYYQCVEYVQRYFNTKFEIQAIWPVNYASQMCSNYPKGISVVKNPQVGDAVVFPWAPYGHTALVTGVNSGSINVIEQNASPSGTNTYSTSGVSCFLRVNK